MTLTCRVKKSPKRKDGKNQEMEEEEESMEIVDEVCTSILPKRKILAHISKDVYDFYDKLVSSGVLDGLVVNALGCHKVH